MGVFCFVLKKQNNINNKINQNKSCVEIKNARACD